MLHLDGDKFGVPHWEEMLLDVRSKRTSLPKIELIALEVGENILMQCDAIQWIKFFLFSIFLIQTWVPIVGHS